MNTEEMKVFAEGFLRNLEPENGTATVIGLRGGLGAGKTTFTQICAKILGIDETVTSPTFVILKKYRILEKFFADKFDHLIHVDAYRLKDGKELNNIGWQNVISEPKNLILVEWPEIVTDVMPKNTVYLDFSVVDEERRQIKYEAKK